MPITEKEMETVKEIVLNGARTHFPSSVQFHDASIYVKLDIDDEELIHVELLYTAPTSVLDGHLMNTLFRVINDPIRAAGITAHTLIHYIDINDPTRRRYRESPTEPAPIR